MEYLANTTKILLLAIFNLMAILFVVSVILKIIKDFIRKVTGKKNANFD